MVYVGSDDFNLYALNASTGAVIWTHKFGYIVRSSPAVANGVVYVGSRWPAGGLHALDAKTGAELWHCSTGSDVNSSPVVVNGVVYVGAYDHHVYAFSLKKGDDGVPTGN